MQIGTHRIADPVVLAPMAGLSDQPFRRLCREWGAAMACAEMLTADTACWSSTKSRTRLPDRDEPAPRVVQIAGTEPAQLATAAQACADLGAEIIDINMGCPAKKVCKRLAGSALMRDETQVARILDAVVAAVDLPVTLKIRTGWDPDSRNAVAVARIAERAGVQALAIHGRSRACGFGGRAEYDTIAEVVAEVGIPVIANGDIESGEQARNVLAKTGAAAVMIGRGALGQPWLFAQIAAYLTTARLLPEPTLPQRVEQISRHVRAMHLHYGEALGVRRARKHVGWYFERLALATEYRATFNRVEEADAQLRFLADLSDQSTLIKKEEKTDLAA